MFGVSREIAYVLWMPFRVKLALSVTVTALSTCDLSGLHFDNCLITQRAGEKKKKSAIGPDALLMLALPAALGGPRLPRTGEVFSLSCPLEGGQGGKLLQNVLPFKGEKQESHLVVPAGYFHAATPLHRFAPAPFRG